MTQGNTMSAALMYCNNRFKKALRTTHKTRVIFDAFTALEQEIKKLDSEAQINLYSVATQFLESLVQDPDDSINPLDVFILRCNSIVGDPHESITKIGLALGVIVISVATVMAGAALGIGIGMMMGLWQTPLLFMAALLAAESSSLVVASASVTSGVGAGLISQFLFFKEPKIKSALNNCVEAIKQSNLSDVSSAENEEDINEAMPESDETSGLRTVAN
jgi:hypothetical protein